MSSIAEQKGACPRCHGFMVPMIGDGSEAVVLEWSELPGWRCINCGERIDPLILANRHGEGSRIQIQQIIHNQGGHDG
jgi:hypothetical protein